MEIKKILAKFNIIHECRQYNVGLWQCPSFVFTAIGLVNVVVMTGTYFLATRYIQPEIVALLVIGATAFIFIIGYSIVQGFEKLAQANKMKTEFVGIVSHQLRTPLAGIRWSLNILEGEQTRSLAEEQKTYLSLIKENNERMIKLVNDLLDVSRIESGKIIFNPSQANLYILVKKIVDNFMAVAKASNIAISLEAPETLPNVYADPDKLTMVVQNLIDNAIKYTKGKGTVQITMERDNKFIKTSVKDGGVGIPENQQKFIFQKFFRSDNVMKHQTIGTGLGLFLVKSIIEQNNGKIWFESQEGQGTTFYFILPIYK